MNNQSFFISQRVINTVQSLPESLRGKIADALAAEMFFGQSPESTLNPVQMVYYVMIKDYVNRDTRAAVTA
ncbi:MAG: hypothetical protein J1E84_08515 [Muribaculaceae bacterium]|nr:hypothetical protein [Muribaculaceae bacterium]